MKSCLARETLVGAATRLRLLHAQYAELQPRGKRERAAAGYGRCVSVLVAADVEVASVQAVVQVHAICSRVR